MRRRLVEEVAQAEILLVDDSPLDHALIRGILRRNAGWKVFYAGSGEEGLLRLHAEPDRWDLLLLDLVMPGMGGFDLLERIASDSRFANLPVVIMTSSESSADRIRALELGADEFLLKPIQAEVARLRIQALLEMRQVDKDLQGLAENRAAQLAHTDRLVALGTLAAGMAHEINNPLTFLSGNLQNLEDLVPVLSADLANVPGWSPPRRLQTLLDSLPRMLVDMRGGVERVAAIVGRLRTFARSGNGRRQVVDAAMLVADARVICGHRLRGIDVVEEESGSIVEVKVEASEIVQVLVNLLSNAADALAEWRTDSVQPCIAIHHGSEGGVLKISVHDNGPGLPQNVLDRLGTLFFTTKPPGKGTGLGISISQAIVAAHGGKFEFSNHPSGGAEFRISLPIHRIRDRSS